MSDELNDIDFKALFEKDFENEEITVSEDLIARTMTAIKNCDKDGSEEPVIELKKENETEITPVPARRNKKAMIRMISGLAAALVIGIVGFMVFRQGGMLEKKSEDRVKESALPIMADTTGNAEKGSEKNYASVSDNMAAVEETAAVSEKADTVDEAAGDQNYGERRDKSSENYEDDSAGFDRSEGSSDSLPQGQKNAISAYDGVQFAAGIQDEMYNEEAKDEAPMEAAAEDTVQESENEEDTVIKSTREILTEYCAIRGKECLTEEEHDKALIRSLNSYKKTMEIGNSIEETLYQYLKESKEDGIETYIWAMLLEDISGKTEKDPEGKDLWMTGSDYLKIYEKK